MLPPLPPDDAVAELSAPELARRLDAPDPPLVLDVREPWEHDVAHLAGARLVPLGTLPAALPTLDPAREYVLLCHHGVRSLMAARFLRDHGIPRVANLTGGIDAWSAAVDPSVPRY